MTYRDLIERLESDGVHPVFRANRAYANAAVTEVRLRTHAGDDVVNTLGTGTRPTWIWGGDGSDTLCGANGVGDIDGGIGDDTLTGRMANDVLAGGAGDDTLNGNTGDDDLDGGSHVNGDTGNGGPGVDTLVIIP
jgi:Ca2+-binding RTX toxin-like protein